MIFFFDPVPRVARALTHCEIEGLCFFITIRCMHTGEQNRVAVVECAYELRHYLNVAKDVEIQQVQMMCPPSISGQHQWALEELESIVVHSGIDTEESAAVYKTEVGAYKVGELDLRKRKKTRVLYSKRHLLNHIAERSQTRSAASQPDLYSTLWRS